MNDCEGSFEKLAMPVLKKHTKSPTLGPVTKKSQQENTFFILEM